MKNNFNYYKLGSKYLFSILDYKDLEKISEDEISNYDGHIYFLCKRQAIHSRRSFSISSPSQIFWDKEDLNILNLESEDDLILPPWILEKINSRSLTSINTLYPDWESVLESQTKKKWRLNLIALGDVGSTLLIGLRLLGGDIVDSIGIYDRNDKTLNRWEHELNQIHAPFSKKNFPKVEIIDKDSLFDCDMFIFCASKGIPPVGSGVSDVRMAQFESNSKIISEYSKMARVKNFKGIFAVVSDPVDLLCKVAFLKSNEDNTGEMDFKGLSSDQIIGYGLGVMNARALYYADKVPDMREYIDEGRVFGPHGKGLIVANSILNYNDAKSSTLTDLTLKANLKVREFGYKPFIAPALSSGALSILATISGEWFYGATYMNSVYMGSSCRLLKSGLEIEQFVLPDSLKSKIQDTYNNLESII